MLTLTPFGAAGEVTGSAYVVKNDKSSVLVDFGMFQGDKDEDARNAMPGPLHRELPNAVVLTHAHLDHCGRLPLLVRDGYAGPIFCTQATRVLTELVLRDAAQIQERDYERRERRALKSGRKVSRSDTPLYHTQDVEATLALIQIVDYDVRIEVTSGMYATFHEAGHILGSASISLDVDCGGLQRTIVFSGDVGPARLPFLRDPAPPTKADVVVLESTYGDRDHRSIEQTLEEFAGILNGAVLQCRRIFVPSFAIGRTQQILFYYAQLRREGRVPDLPMFIDSPMAISATRIYGEHTSLFDEESSALEEAGSSALHLPNVAVLESAQDSMTINTMSGPFMVIAGSGMCNGGRILYHLRNAISSALTDILIVGYQAKGSLGRKLVDGAKDVVIMGEHHDVKASIHTLGGLSAHAGQTELVQWVHTMMASKPKIILTHGEDLARTALAGVLLSRYGVAPTLPVYGETIEL